MALKDDLRDILDKVEGNASKWLLVAVGVILLLRLKLVLFACALPVMAYWHFSNQPDDARGAEASEEADDAVPDHDSAEPWPPMDDEDDDMGFRPSQRADKGLDNKKDEVDPYDQSFWSQGDSAGTAAPKKAAAPWRTSAQKDGLGVVDGLDEDDHLGLGRLGGLGGEPALSPAAPAADDFAADHDFRGSPPSMGAFAGRKPLGDDLDDFLGNLGDGSGKNSGGGFGLGGGIGGGLDDDFDFLGGRQDDDLDLMGGGRPKGKGKGKGKGDKGGKDPMAPREPNPKQVFVANVGDMEEEEIRQFFEEVGDVDRLKVLRQEDGSSKGVCFVTFRTEEQAREALKLHGRPLDGGRNLVVRLAHGGNKGEKGEKGGSKGERRNDRFGSRDEGPLDLGGSERFGAAFGFGRDREDRTGFGDRSSFGDRGKGKGGKGKGNNRMERGEMDEILEEALADGDGPLRPGDFDFAARRFLAELKTRDQKDGTARLQEALDMVLKYTSSKDRSSVRKWPAYVFTLLQKFDTNLWDELRERDAARRAEKGGDKGGSFRRQTSDDD